MTIKSTIKPIFKLAIDAICTLVSLFFSYRLFTIYEYAANCIYTHLLMRKLYQCGRNIRLDRRSSFIGLGYISIGSNFVALRNTRIEAISDHLSSKYNPTIVIGDNVSLNTDCHIGCINKILIEDDVLIASKVFITDHFHGDSSYSSIGIAPSKRILLSRGPVIIEKAVWIGEGAAIMPGVRIGKGSIVGANAVVTKDVPSYSVVVGSPARIIRDISHE
jgi:acetyltransferase-like isoleucine patch superfamily enzyme